ncbi:MAG: gliding motility-associated C-terminal domain-containing protein [Bacteroidetes bacterium]|nr:gliding motility-associated C-terminal domain-containing protein [Bacteroidota bacterium]
MRKLLPSLFFLCPFVPLLSQNLLPLNTCASTCTGNLGDNSFTDGDFGFGMANILPTDPMLAPGYKYQLNPPPDDGYYSITNNTSNWGSFAATAWINIADNGPEANGYMMVVNASYQPGLFYQKTVPVCENTLYELSMDVINLMEPFSSAIMPNIAFLIDGNLVCETGIILNDAHWRTFRFSFTTLAGQTNVQLSLRNNAPGGIGNDLALDNIAFRACGPEINLPLAAYFCAGKSLELNANFQNSPYSSTVYQWQFAASAGAPWTNLPNANAPSLLIPNPEDSSLYRLVVANTAGNLNLPYCRAVSAPVQPVLEDLSGFAIYGNDTIICNAAPAILRAGNFAAYTWSNGTHSDTLEVETPGIYAVTINTASGCVAHDSIQVNEVYLTATASWTNPVCAGDSTGSARILQTSGGLGQISYQLDQKNAQSDPSFLQIPAGDHFLIAEDSVHCRYEIPFNLEDPPAYYLELGANAQIVEGDSLLLIPQYNYVPVFYQWQSNGDLPCVYCPAALVHPQRNATYFLQVQDAKGCQASDSILIGVLPNVQVFAPNVFATDDENSTENQYFTLFSTSSAESILHLRVFDRWGNLMFEVKNVVPGSRASAWNGSDLQGRRAPSGVYTWLAEIRFFDGSTRKLQGSVTLLNK